MSEAMQAEFDTVAAWTAEVALDLGSEYVLPAACRGSGSPASLRWLLDRLGVSSQTRMFDCGAGVGGPAAFAAREVGVTPVLSDPEAGACRAARRLFGLPVVQASSQLPFASASFDVVWCLGVLCTVQDQRSLLAELRRVLTPEGRLGLLVFAARSLPLSDQPSGNNFPTEDGLRQLLAEANLRVENTTSAADFVAPPAQWQDLADAVEAELERRHAGDPGWDTARSQSQQIGTLLGDGEISGTLVVARPA